MKTVMRPNEVARWIPAVKSYDKGVFCDAIFEIEYDLFDGCIGLDYRELMIAAMIDYSDVKDHDEEKAYILDETCLFDGKIYKSLVGANTSFPSDESKWTLAPYFTDENFNFLWIHGMAKWIASSVYYDTIIPTTYKNGNKGLQKYQNDQAEQVTVSYRELGVVRGDTSDKTKRAYSVLKKVIERYHGKDLLNEADEVIHTYDFSGIEFMKDTLDCGVVSCEDQQDNNRIAFNW